MNDHSDNPIRTTPADLKKGDLEPGIEIRLDEFRNLMNTHSTRFRDFYVERMKSHPSEYPEEQSLKKWYEEFQAWIDQGLDEETL